MLSAIHLFGGIFGGWDHFFGFFQIFLSQIILKNAMFRNLLRFCLTSKHLETKLNYQKHIKFYEFHPKYSRKKVAKIF